MTSSAVLIVLYYSATLALLFLFPLTVGGFPLATFFVATGVGVVLILSLYSRKFANTLVGQVPFPSKILSLFVISILVINFAHEHQSFALKGLSMLLYAFVPLLFLPLIIDHRARALFGAIVTIILYVVLSTVFVVDVSNEKVEILAFSTRTNLAWFVLFLWIFDLNKLNANKLTIILVLLFLLVNGSRGPLIGFGIIQFFYLTSRHTLQLRYRLLMFISIIGFVFLVAGMNQFDLAFERLTNIGNQSYGSSTGYRLMVLSDGLTYGSDKLFGQGFGTFQREVFAFSSLDLSTKEHLSTDNSFIDILLDVGYFPIIIIATFFYSLRGSNLECRVALVFLFLLFMLDGIIYNNAWYYIIFMFLSFNAISLSRSMKRL